MDNFYPKAFENRLDISDPQVRKSQRAFSRAAGSNFLVLQILFLGLFCWIFGALFQQSDHTHNIKIVFVDYDGGAVGAALRAAYATLQGLGFPSLVEASPAALSSPASLGRAVCRADYWAALYVTKGSSDRLQAALAGGLDAATLNRTDILTYVWNEARYSSVVDSIVSSQLQTLSSAARVAYTTANGTARIKELTSPEAISVSAEPWQLTGINIQPTTQGSRAVYNTLVFILIQIQEFFYLGTLNGLYVSNRLYSRLSPHRMVIVRDIISLLYCLIGSLCTTGAIWACRAGWHVDGSQFVMSWMALWLFAHINFLQLDVFTVWLPPPYVPMALISWVIFNVTSILLPFELSPGFYRVGYAAPAHEVYQVLINIWSRGCNPRLHYALPILFAWWIWGLALSGLGVYRRSHYALLREQEEARQLREKLDAAVDWERQRKRRFMEEEGEQSPTASVTQVDSRVTASPVPKDERWSTEHVLAREAGENTDSDMRATLSRMMTRQSERTRRSLSWDGDALRFGPAFSLPFGRTAELESGPDE